MNAQKTTYVLLGIFLLTSMMVTMAFPFNSSATSYPITVTDDLGRNITIPKEPMRIISLAPSNTEILFALGLGDRVVGVTDYCDYPAQARQKEKIGGPWTPDVEKIVGLQPDLILAAGVNPLSVIGTLENLGLTVFGIEAIDLNDLLNDIETVGLITNREAEAETLTTDMTRRIRAIKGRTTWLAPEEKPKVLHVCWHDPIYTAGHSTFIHDVIVAAGGVNIFADLEGYKSVSLEQVISRDPEVIIVTAMGGVNSVTWTWVNTEPRLENVPARKNGRIYYIESNWLERPGPRIVLGLEAVAKRLHPNIFFEPSDYDEDRDGKISKSEAVKAISDYTNGVISKKQAIQVVMAYFASN